MQLRGLYNELQIERTPEGSYQKALQSKVTNIYDIIFRPFECNECGAKFSGMSTLRKHKNKHTKEKPYQCNFEGCNKRFAEKGNLKSHFRVHVNKTFIVEKKRKIDNERRSFLHNKT